MTPEAKSSAEAELLLVQKEKLLAEIAVLRRTTPLTESIKVFGSMVLGIGGAVAAVAGFQLAEVKAEKYKLEASAAEKSRDAAAQELKTLTASRDQLRVDAEELRQKVEAAKTKNSWRGLPQASSWFPPCWPTQSSTWTTAMASTTRWFS